MNSKMKKAVLSKLQNNQKKGKKQNIKIYIEIPDNYDLKSIKKVEELFDNSIYKGIFTPFERELLNIKERVQNEPLENNMEEDNERNVD